ncbi:tyrosine recombinase XerC [Bacteroidia bacterium]|nr:tyrosine recombinase XerC [Bacteroidia bacterium]
MLDKFIEYLKVEKRYSAHTVNGYLADIERFMGFVKGDGGQIDPTLITAQDVRLWVASLARGGALKASSINKMMCSVRAWFRYLLRTGAIERDPSLGIGFLKTGKPLPSSQPQKRMLAVVERLEQDAEGETEHFWRLRNQLIIVLLYSTGLRLAELLAIDRSDLSDDLLTLKVHGKGDKERIVPLIEPLRERLMLYLEAARNENICISGEKPLFLTKKRARINRSEVYRLVRRELGDAGVSGKRSPHTLRHTFATHLMDNGAGMREIQELLGHSSLGTTQVYTHNSIARLKEVYKKAHPRGEKNKT